MQDEEWNETLENGERNEESDHSEIQEILDVGYEHLDQFVQWSEETLGLDTRTTQQDCFNAESLIDYLANAHRKPADAINEFELRWFVFSHYIRRAMADVETEERLPDSLRRYFEFLRSEYAYFVPDWLYDTLDDRNFYMKRLRDYHALDSEDERTWQEGFRAWCDELEADLDSRSLWLPREIGEGLQWQDPMGWREATLHEEANQLWQKERSELLSEGLDYERVRAQLINAYEEWLNTPQSRLDEATPFQVIQEERLERAEQQEPEEDEE